MEQRKVKSIIILLAVLPALSLLALGFVLAFKKSAEPSASTAAAPDNLIAPDGETAGFDLAESQALSIPENSPSETRTAAHPTDIAAPTQSPAAKDEKSSTIELYRGQPEQNTPFCVNNLFPGDSETRVFCVRVSYHDEILVHYQAEVRSGYEKVSEVLRVRIRLRDTEQIMYDGLMRDMPQGVTHKLSSEGSSVDELTYEITAYLDTSVGNEYQGQDLIADFHWWVEGVQNLDAPPTGDSFQIWLWVALGICCGRVLFLLLAARRHKEGNANG